MAIKATTTKDFTQPTPPTVVATEIETTHMVFNFNTGEGIIKQKYVDIDGNLLGRRFIKVSGPQYSGVEADIHTKIQNVTNKIESGQIVLEEGTDFEEVERQVAMETMRSQ